MELDLLKPKRNNKRSNKDSEKDAVEWIKCQQNPLYFIYNYVHILETGGSIKFDKEIVHHKMRRTIQSIYNYHNAILMASRQLGKSTIAGCLIVWASVFYPKNSSIILNMKQNAALNNLRIIRFIIENLPVWMVGNKPLKQKSEIKTYLHLFNDSHIQVFYPSTILISRFIQ